MDKHDGEVRGYEDLIARLEAAGEGNRELDCDIELVGRFTGKIALGATARQLWAGR